MKLKMLLYLCLLGGLESALGETSRLSSSIDGTSGSSTLTKQRYRMADTASSDITTPINDVETSDSDNSSYPLYECETTKMVNISLNNEELASSKNEMDQMYNRTMTAYHSFVGKKNQTMGDFTMNLTKKYMGMSKQFLEDVQLEVRCQNITASEKSKIIEDMQEYELKLEMVDILSNVILKKRTDEAENILLHNTNDSQPNYTQEMMSFFEELQSLVVLYKKGKELYVLGAMLHEKYWKYQQFEDLTNFITTLKETVAVENEILHIIRSSKKIQLLYEDEYMSNSNMIRNLVNVSMWEADLKFDEEYLRSMEDVHVQYEKHNTFRFVIGPATFAVIFAVGITGNGVLLLVFINHKDMRTAPNVMIINLTVADIMGLFISIFFGIYSHLITGFIWGNYICKWYIFFKFLAFGASIYSVVIISTQRFLALSSFFRFTTSRNGFCGRHMPLLSVLFVWGFTTIFAIIRVFRAQVENSICWSTLVTDTVYYQTLIRLNLGVYFFIPFTTIAITSGISSWKLKYSAKNIPGESMGHDKVKEARVLSANIFIVIIACFASGYMPYLIFTIYRFNAKSQLPFEVLSHIDFGLYCLMYTMANFNPIGLYIVSRKFRKYMNIYLLCGIRKTKIIPRMTKLFRFNSKVPSSSTGVDNTGVITEENKLANSSQRSKKKPQTGPK